MEIFYVGDTAFELKKTITRDGFMRLFAENKDLDKIVELSLDPNVDFVKGFLSKSGVPGKRGDIIVIKTYEIANGNEVRFTYFLDLLLHMNLITEFYGVIPPSDGILMGCPIVTIKPDRMDEMTENDFLKI